MDVAQLFRKEILEATAYAVPFDEDAVKLNQNESPWDVPIEIKIAITERLIKTDFNRYPETQPLPVKKKLAKLNGVMPDQVAVANGSNVLIQALVHATSYRGKGKVMILDPTFSVYELQARLFGCAVAKIPLSPEFLLSTETALAEIRKEKPSVIFIANPNAPTGNLFARESLYKIVKAAPCLTVIDEAYHPFSAETVLDWIPEFPHLVVLRTLSKAYALAGARLGYAIADAEVTQQIEKALMPFCVSAVSCVIAEEALDRHQYADEYVKRLLKSRRRVYEELQGLQKLKAFPSDANFILVRVDDAPRIFRELKQRGVLVRDVGDGNLLKNCLRLSIGTDEENAELLAALKAVLK